MFPRFCFKFTRNAPTHPTLPTKHWKKPEITQVLCVGEFQKPFPTRSHTLPRFLCRMLKTAENTQVFSCGRNEIYFSPILPHFLILCKVWGKVWEVWGWCGWSVGDSKKCKKCRNFGEFLESVGCVGLIFRKGKNKWNFRPLFKRCYRQPLPTIQTKPPLLLAAKPGSLPRRTIMPERFRPFSRHASGKSRNPLHSGTPIKSACATICTSWSRTPSQTTNSRKRSCSGTVSAPYRRFYTPLHKRYKMTSVWPMPSTFDSIRSYIKKYTGYKWEPVAGVLRAAKQTLFSCKGCRFNRHPFSASFLSFSVRFRILNSKISFFRFLRNRGSPIISSPPLVFFGDVGGWMKHSCSIKISLQANFIQQDSVTGKTVLLCKCNYFGCMIAEQQKPDFLACIVAFRFISIVFSCNDLQLFFLHSMGWIKLIAYILHQGCHISLPPYRSIKPIACIQYFPCTVACSFRLPLCCVLLDVFPFSITNRYWVSGNASFINCNPYWSRLLQQG